MTPRSRPPLAPTPEERTTALEVLNPEGFVDQAPPAIYATLLDEGIYHCSVRTLYRILAQEDAVRERRTVRPDYHKPELLATGPNRLWSWDITKLKGPQTWTYFYLYVILDVYSRYGVGWLVAERESAALAEPLITETRRKEDITRDQLTLHADGGSAMTSKKVALLLGRSQRHHEPQPPLRQRR